jgi:HK97 family phage portal protein
MSFLDRFRRKPKARKSVPLGSFALMQPFARFTPRHYAALAREGYQGNPVGHRAVRLIAEAAAQVPWLLYQGEAEIADHPLLQLLARPNPLQGGTAFFETLYGFLLVSGNAYVEAAMMSDGPRELHLLRPDRVSIAAGADGWPEAYDYNVGGAVTRFTRDAAGFSPILHLKLFHPLDDHYGLSPLEAAATAIDIHNQGAVWSKALLDNAALPSGALVYHGPDAAPNLSEEQFSRLKSELETQIQGSRNAGRPLLLEGGLSWTAMSHSPQDMDFINARHVAAREIALAFGVPPMLLGIPGDNTYANYREANLALWRQTVIPLLTKTADALSAWLGAGEGLRLSFDLDQVSALSAEREALWSRVNAASFLTEDEKRAAVGYGPAP